MENKSKTSLYLINGPLGAGKTTFLRQLLSLPGFENARIIENEFASASVDTEQLHDHQAEVRTIAGVCICCSTGDELTEALRSLSDSEEPVVIEATGVANSLKLIEKIVVADMLDSYDIKHAIFILDAVEAMHDIRQVVATYRNELKAADTVLISKSDLLSEEGILKLMDVLGALHLSQVGFVRDGVFDASLVMGESRILRYFAELNEAVSNHDGESNYTIIDMNDHKMSADKIRQSWQPLVEKYGLKRLKGNFVDPDGNKWHVEATPSQIRITEYQSGALQFVLIGSNARLVQRSTIEDLEISHE